MKRNLSRCRRLIVVLLGVTVMVGSAGNTGPDIRVFPEKERMEMLKAYWTRMSKEQPIQTASLKDWGNRQAFLRKQAMAGFGLDPLLPRVPLNLTYGPSIERDDCTISWVYFQTFPGIYATGFLYMPKKAEFPAPAVFHSHGHWASGAANDALVESRCIGLAHRGYVSLVVQPVARLYCRMK
ncbi:MAG: hypothetical protein L6437_04715 [Kiritimatiellae bacterium]|nr:hypothetical protein [Verrucomicrobiota bacterium]MCG2659532.1 hypothetical protein [Kiritimatiellia bacterium]